MPAKVQMPGLPQKYPKRIVAPANGVRGWWWFVRATKLLPLCGNDFAKDGDYRLAMWHFDSRLLLRKKCV